MQTWIIVRTCYTIVLDCGNERIKKSFSSTFFFYFRKGKKLFVWSTLVSIHLSLREAVLFLNSLIFCNLFLFHFFQLFFFQFFVIFFAFFIHQLNNQPTLACHHQCGTPSSDIFWCFFFIYFLFNFFQVYLFQNAIVQLLHLHLRWITIPPKSRSPSHLRSVPCLCLCSNLSF